MVMNNHSTLLRQVEIQRSPEVDGGIIYVTILFYVYAGIFVNKNISDIRKHILRLQ